MRRARSWCVPLTRLYRDCQPVRRRCQRADPAGIVGAGRAVREVEVEHEQAVLGPEIGALHRVEQIAAAAVASVSTRRVAEGQEGAAAVAAEPVHLERETLAAKLEPRAGEGPEVNLLVAARRDGQRR